MEYPEKLCILLKCSNFICFKFSELDMSFVGELDSDCHLDPNFSPAKITSKRNGMKPLYVSRRHSENSNLSSMNFSPLRKSILSPNL